MINSLSKFYFSVILVVLFFPNAFGQKDIKSKITKQHELVKGTKVYIVPPSGFVTSSSSNGYKHDSSSSSMVIMNLPVAYKTSILGIDKESLEQQGIKNTVMTNIKVNGLPGLYITGEHAAFGTIFQKTFLFFGNDKESAIINASSLLSKKSFGDAMLKSIQTIYLDTKTIFDPFMDLDYTVSTGQMKMVKKMNSSLVYNTDGNLPSKSKDRTSFIIGKSNNSMKIDDQLKFAKERLAKYSVILDSIINTNEVKVNGLSGIELIATGKEKGSTELMRFYQLILFEEKNYYISFGSTNENFERNIAMIAAIAKSFKRK